MTVSHVNPEKNRLPVDKLSGRGFVLCTPK